MQRAQPGDSCQQPDHAIQEHTSFLIKTHVLCSLLELLQLLRRVADYKFFSKTPSGYEKGGSWSLSWPNRSMPQTISSIGWYPNESLNRIQLCIFPIWLVGKVQQASVWATGALFHSLSRLPKLQITPFMSYFKFHFLSLSFFVSSVTVQGHLGSLFYRLFPHHTRSQKSLDHPAISASFLSTGSLLWIYLSHMYVLCTHIQHCMPLSRSFNQALFSCNFSFVPLLLFWHKGIAKGGQPVYKNTSTLPNAPFHLAEQQPITKHNWTLNPSCTGVIANQGPKARSSSHFKRPNHATGRCWLVWQTSSLSKSSVKLLISWLFD